MILPAFVVGLRMCFRMFSDLKDCGKFADNLKQGLKQAVDEGWGGTIMLER